MGVVYSRISSSTDQQAKWRHSLQFFAWQQVPTPKLRPRQMPSHGTAMVASMATDLVWAMEVMALATATARGLLMLMPMPGMDTVVFTATVSQPMADTAMLDTATARGLLTLRLTPGSDMVDFTATVLAWAMAAMAMEVLATDTERGPLRPSLRPMPGMDMVAFTATALAWAMAAMAM